MPLIILFEYLCQERSINPINIIKMRKHDFIEYYEVKWSKMNRSNKWNDNDLSELVEYTTLEKPEIFEIYYPEITNDFKQKLAMKKSTSKSLFISFIS